MKNLYYWILWILIWFYIWTLSYSPWSIVWEKDLEDIDIQVVEDLDGFSTQSLSDEDRYIKYTNTISRITAQNTKLTNFITKYTNITNKNTTIKIPALKNKIAALVGLYECTSTGWNFDASYTWCYGPSGSTVVDQWWVVCYFNDDIPPNDDCLNQS